MKPQCAGIAGSKNLLKFPTESEIRAKIFPLANSLPPKGAGDYIEHFHKWRCISYSFLFMLIGSNGLTLV